MADASVNRKPRGHSPTTPIPPPATTHHDVEVHRQQAWRALATAFQITTAALHLSLISAVLDRLIDSDAIPTAVVVAAISNALVSVELRSYRASL